MAMSDNDSTDPEAIRLHLDGPEKSSWYHGRLGRKAAEQILDSRPTNCFLVRESITKPGVFVLSFLGRESISHFRITSICGEFYIGGRQFVSLEDLIAYYTSYSDLLPGERLLHPIAPDQRVDDVRYVKAVFPYHSPTPDTDELEFDKGDIFSVSNELADGWLWAVNQRTGQSGTIYSDLFIDLHDDESGEKVEELDYYHPLVTNSDVIDILTKAGMGSYLLRSSDKTPGDYTLCLFSGSTLHRFKITRHGKGFIMGKRFFTRVSDIIERYKHEPIVEENNQKLVYAVRSQTQSHDSSRNDNNMKRVIQLMRQSSTGVNLISKKQNQYHFSGYLYMRKDKSKKTKKLFFALNAEAQHLYYVENPKRSKPDGIIDLNYSSIYPVHESLLARPGCIQLESSAINNYQIYYLWSEPTEEIQKWKEWLKPFCKNTKLECREHSRRGVREVLSLNVNIVESKPLSDRLTSGTLYCLVNLNALPVAKTQSKEPSNPVWDEEFLVSDMPANVEYCTITLCFKSKKSGSKDQELYQVSKRISDLISIEDYDEWLTMTFMPTTSNIIQDTLPAPHIRIKLRYKHDIILPMQDYVDFRTVLLSKDCQIVSALGVVCDNLSDRTTLAQSLLKVFRYDKREATLLKTLTSVEIADEENAATLFRSTSLATTLMDQYMKLTASEFVRAALYKTVQRITDGNLKVELDPKILDNASGLDANRGVLIDLLNELLASIISAKDHCPMMLRHICNCLQRNVAKRWPDNEIVKPRVVSGFIFLRLLCPALLDPKRFNLVSETPQDSAIRTLKLVAKSLINLANLVEVGAKEMYMEAIGPFIIDNKPKMVTFLNDLADVPELPEAYESMPAPEDIARELSIIHKICSSHMKNLQAKSASQPALKKLVAAIQALDMTKNSYCAR